MLNSLYKKKTIVFDYDGTLVDSNKIKHECFFLSTKNFINKHDKLKNIINKNPNFDRYDIFLKFGEIMDLDDKDIQGLVKNYNSIVHQKIVQAKEIPGSTKIIEIARKKKMHIYVNSATPKVELIKSIMQRQIKIRKENIFGKPNSKMKNMKEILKIEDNLNNIIFVGDGLLDKKCAEQFNIDFACIRNESNRSWSSKERYNIKDNFDLIKLLFPDF